MPSPDCFPSTLPEVFSRAAASTRGRGLGMIDGRGRRSELRPWPEVFRAAEAAAGRLAAVGVGAREPVLVGFGNTREFVELWLGAVLRGAWPVAVSPPAGVGSSEVHVRRLDAVLAKLEARRFLCSDAMRREAETHGLAALRDATVTAAELAAEEPVSFEAPRPAPEDVAFLQLTSGSTGVPRAVAISHRGATHNPPAMVDAIAAGDDAFRAAVEKGDAACVSWLPLHHDMGLVGCLLNTILYTEDLWLAAPKTFLGRPHTWLQNLAQTPYALAPAPNFAYQTCVERVTDAQLEGCDLSSWRAAMTGAEMIRPETVAAFNERFEPFGFDPAAFRPCYGLAEGTLAVTFDRRGDGVRTRPVPGEDREVVSVGPPVADTEVRITAPDGTPRAGGEVGEVRVGGPGVFLGYHNDPDETAASLVDGWLVTGDLGFLQEGELHLTGRTKDILIVNGQNLMPHELEWVAESVTGGGGTSRAGAFSIPGAGGERAVVVVETGESDGGRLGELEREVKVRIGRALSIPLADCVFVRRGKLPKTTSGKVQRLELRRRYLEGDLERVEAGVS